ncbi:hypothetical protein KPG66_12070 [Mycetohabitans sp. B2]|uniref:hypothetical protein n=1 Tax=Mycetohabitans sp. B2 TaxID=2841274 RepID=UPI001F334CDB|nr:hypothetical protein [Mycetohabitans sp. B2]MCF7696800.1 hypothetical protein [Mycetohabitans sp. B2]
MLSFPTFSIGLPLPGASRAKKYVHQDKADVHSGPPKIEVEIASVADCSGLLKELNAISDGAPACSKASLKSHRWGTASCSLINKHAATIDELKAWRRGAAPATMLELECPSELYAQVKRLVEQRLGESADRCGALAIDADEFVHCLYVMVVTLIQVSKGDGAGVEAAFRQASELLAHDPVGWLKDAGIPHGIADMAVTAGMTGPLLALAGLAIKEGLAEWRRARKTDKALAQALDQVDEEIVALQALSALLDVRRHNADGTAQQCNDGMGAPATPASNQPLPKLTTIKQERRAALRFLRKQNDADKVIGASSFVSGSAIATKCIVDTTLKGVYIGQQGSVAATTAAGAAGMVGSAALGPMAAAGSLALGGYMLHKSRKKRDAFRAEKQSTDSRIASWLKRAEVDRRSGASMDPPYDEHTLSERYARFLREKTQQHDAFFTRYTDWNKGFVAGSGLYTACTVSKLALAGIVAAGGTALATPAAPVVLMAGTGLASAAMIFFSMQYLKGHGKLQRYQRYYHDDDPELDRHFLASVDLLCADDQPGAGFDLRKLFYYQAAAREDQRQNFLADVAAQCAKRFDDQYTYTADDDEVIRRRGPKPNGKQQLTQLARRTGEAVVGRAKAASAFVRTVRPDAQIRASQAARSAWRNASGAARNAWNASRRHLTRTSLQAWLADPANHAEQARVLKQMIETQLIYLERKLETKHRAYRHIERGLNANSRAMPAHCRDVAGEQAPAAASTPDVAASDIQRLVLGLSRDIENDECLYRQAVLVRDALSALASRHAPTPGSRQLLACAIEQFISTQQGTLPDAGRPLPDLDVSHDRLATYFMKEAPVRYKDLRGKLVETELQSTRIGHVWEQRMASQGALYSVKRAAMQRAALSEADSDTTAAVSASADTRASLATQAGATKPGATRETPARSSARYWPRGWPARSALAP